MIIQNTNHGSLHAGLVSNGAPQVVVANGVVPEAVAIVSRQAVPQQPSPQQLNDAVSTLNQAMRQSNQSVEFSVDSNTKKPIVKMSDAATGEVLRQFPSEEMLAIARSIDQFLQLQHGLLLKQQA